MLQGYDLDIRHIPGKKNPADSLSRQLVTDALVRKSSVTDANAEFVQKLRVSENATHEEIQEALHQLFSSSPQGQCSQSKKIQDPQGQSVLTTNEATGPQGTENEARAIIGATAVSKVQLDNSLRNSLHSFLQHESPYAEILQELQNGSTQVIRNFFVFKRMHKILYVHDHSQDANLDFWRIVVPDNEQMKSQVVQELHCTPYSAHPRI